MDVVRRLRPLLNWAVVAVFVDGVWIHRWWHCHCIPERSFSVDGRQFHVCSRCTGIIVGLSLSWSLLLTPQLAAALALIFGLALSVDGLTQLAGLRRSNNLLRFLTGFGTALAGPGALRWLGGR